MIRVLYVAPLAERGGQEVILLNIVKHLDRSRFSPSILFLQQGPFLKEVEDTGIDAVVIESGRVRSVVKGSRTIARIRRLLVDRRIDVVHTLNAKAHIYGGLGALLTRRRCVFHLQSVPTPTLTRAGMLSLLAVATPADRTIACSHYVASAFKAAWRLRRNVPVIHSGVTLDCSQARDGAASLRHEWAVPDAAPLVVMACRLQRWKGVHVLVEAVTSVLRRCPDARFLVVGGSLFGLEPDYRESLLARVKTLGIERAVTFTGFRHDVLRFLAAADVVVHASIAPDPYPTVIIESLTLGRPVVASDTGGSRELIEDGVTGLLIPPDSSEALADALVKLLRDQGQQRRIGRAGAEKAAIYLHADRMAREFEDVYGQLMR